MFEVYGESARIQSGIETLMYLPLVSKDDIFLWEEYSVANQGWMEESRTIILGGDEGTLQASDYLDESISPVLFDVPGERASGDGPFAPIWQLSPPPFSAAFVNVSYLARF
jgi:hypothetical protein